MVAAVHSETLGTSEEGGQADGAGAVPDSETGEQTKRTADQPEAGDDLRERRARRRGSVGQGVGRIRGKGSRRGGRTVRKAAKKRAGRGAG